MGNASGRRRLLAKLAQLPSGWASSKAARHSAARDTVGDLAPSRQFGARGGDPNEARRSVRGAQDQAPMGSLPN
jgi:hypothetical protein